MIVAGTDPEPPMHMQMLDDSSTGAFCAVTLTAGIVHRTLTHGAGAPEIWNVQPAIVPGSVMTSTGLPAICTVSLVGITVTVPA